MTSSQSLEKGKEGTAALASSSTIQERKSSSIRDIFQFTTKLDVLYMIVGGIAAIITGVSIPLFNVLFGEIMDELNGDGTEKLGPSVNKIAILFAYFAVINFITGILQVGCYCC